MYIGMWRGMPAASAPFPPAAERIWTQLQKQLRALSTR